MLMSLGGNISTTGQPRTRGQNEPKGAQPTNTFTSAERKQSDTAQSGNAGKRRARGEKQVSIQELNEKEQRKRNKSELSKKRRLEKNRISAKQSRVRKKHYQEELERQLDLLRAENLRLRTLNQNYAERQRLSVLQNFQSIDEFLSGRQELYKVLEEKLENKSFTTAAEIQ